MSDIPKTIREYNITTADELPDGNLQALIDIGASSPVRGFLSPIQTYGKDQIHMLRMALQRFAVENEALKKENDYLRYRMTFRKVVELDPFPQ